MMSLPYVPTYNEASIKPDWYVAERLDYCEKREYVKSRGSASFVKLFASFLISLF